MKKIWFITGSSKGLGNSLAKLVLKNGDSAVITARNTGSLRDIADRYKDQALVLELDVTDSQQIKAAVNRAIDRFGRIDVLVNNAGFGITGATEAFSEQDLKEQLSTNLYGPIELCRTVIPHMRLQGSGNIVNISSVGGRAASIGLSIYQTAKFGLSGFSEALANELAPLGIKVTAVEPGGMKTEWAGNSMKFAEKVEGYATTVDVRAEGFKAGKFVPKSDPDTVAEVIVRISTETEPPVHLILGSDAVGFLKQSQEKREVEFQKWLPVSLSTDAIEESSNQ